jgi:nucleotide-binding universal stress UspA family protein
MAVEIDTVLVPVDGTDQSEAAVEYAFPIAKKYDARVHILHVMDEKVARGIENGTIKPDAVADEHRAFMKVVHDQARDIDGHVPVSQSTVLGFSSSQLSQHPVSVVLDAAEEIEADLIVIPRESSVADPNAMLGKVAQYVLSYASQPVLSV